MALVNCPDCGREVSDAAPTCPGCGRPIAEESPRGNVETTGGGKACRHCRGRQVAKVRGLQGLRELLVFLVLFVLGVIPGLVYYVWQESVPYCAGCGRRA